MINSVNSVQCIFNTYVYRGHVLYVISLFLKDCSRWIKEQQKYKVKLLLGKLIYPGLEMKSHSYFYTYYSGYIVQLTFACELNFIKCKVYILSNKCGSNCVKVKLCTTPTGSFLWTRQFVRASTTGICLMQMQLFVSTSSRVLWVYVLHVSP